MNKILLLTVLVLQCVSSVLLSRYTRSSVAAKEDLYRVSHCVLTVEVGKVLLNLVLEYYDSRGKVMASLMEYTFRRPMEAGKLAVPAVLYFVQNSLVYVALSHLTAPLFQVCYQSKLIITALLSVIILGRSYTFQQWVCLCVLSIGVALVVLGETTVVDRRSNRDTTTTSSPQDLFLGLVAVTVAGFCSALAGVYFEKIVKQPQQRNNNNDQEKSPSLFMVNIQLASFSIFVAACQVVATWRTTMTGDTTTTTPIPFFRGFTKWVWILVVLHATGGLLVSAVMKYADNVVKGVATGFGILIATGLSAVFFHTPLTVLFVVGACLIVGSAYVFANPLSWPLCGDKRAFSRRTTTGRGSGMLLIGVILICMILREQGRLL